MSRILVISDTQAPFHHRDTIPFLQALDSEVSPDTVIHIGDEVDHHAMGRFVKHPNAPGAGDEHDQSVIFLKSLEKLFPVVYVCTSNHLERLWKRQADAGIPDQWVKSPSEAFGLPNWHWAREWVIETPQGDVMFSHGTRMRGALRYAQTIGMSSVMGHHHSLFQIQHANARFQTLFGMNVGALVDDDSYALAYGKDSPLGSFLGCGAVIDGWPRLFAMETDKHKRWTGRIV